MSIDLLDRLQKDVLGEDRFIELGLRTEGVFLGTRDRFNDPRPEFIGARPQDLEGLVNGLLQYDQMLQADSRGSFSPDWIRVSRRQPRLNSSVLQFRASSRISRRSRQKAPKPRGIFSVPVSPRMNSHFVSELVATLARTL